VPTHWDIRRLKTCLARNDGGVWGDDFDPEGTIVLRSTEQSVGGDWKIDDPARRSLSPSERAAALLAEGDLVITKSSGSELHIGKTSIVSTEVAALGCCFSNFMQRLRCDRRTAPGFVHYILNSPIGREQMVYGSNTSTGLANLNGGVIGNIIACWPPLPEQQAIAGWLDERTRRIDDLVAAKRRLLGLLAEQRTALITHAITKGLNPHAPMKPSGIDWLGDVPSHWEMKRISFLTEYGHRIMYGIVLPGPHFEGGVPIVKAGDVATRLVRAELRCTDPEIEAGYERSRLREGDVVYAIRGSIGTCQQVPAECAGVNITQDTAKIAARKDMNGRWLLHAMRSGIVFAMLEAGAVGATIRGINIRDLKRVKIPVPPRAEQDALSDYLDGITERFDALTATTETAIVRLTEYRQALISAAVTGKINVCSIASVTTLTSEQPVHSSLNERDSETKE
jgi:type I restriction enzyme S subunit